ncbi:uncharacterized protein LOC133874773 [Alnus glutinosa]|uniref:uncharacterized protein LOC133874773 n=1 Tax=Alnus glutinosa TaxID=3517 RepID=UPI002D780C9B|nr:uncharacterized protein LOC133874773 [Alnus glutinosa]
MSCFPAKVMAALVVAVFLLVGGIHIPPTSASLFYGGRKSLSLDGSVKTTPRLEGSSEDLNNLASKKIVSVRILRGRGLKPPPPPTRNIPTKWKSPPPPFKGKSPPPPPILG